MKHDDLRQSPIYKRALQAPDVMGRIPAGHYRRRKNANYDDAKVQEACLRLDHLIRNAIDINQIDYGLEFLTEWIVSAIKAFAKHLEATLPGKWPYLTPQTRNEITARIEFCKRIAAASDQEHAEASLPPRTAEQFEREVALKGSAIYPPNGDITIDDLIYGSPFWGEYAGTTYCPVSLNDKFVAFHRRMRTYWH